MVARLELTQLLTLLKIKMEYTNEDLKIDLEWFKLHNIGTTEAQNYILCLLNKSPSKDLKFN